LPISWKGRAPFDDDLAMHGKAGEIEPLGDFSKLPAQAVAGRAMAANVDVEASFRSGRLDVERLVRGTQAVGEVLRHDRRPLQSRCQHGADLDLDQIVGTCRHETDAHAILFAAGMEGDAPTPNAVSIDQRCDLGRDSGARERRHHLLALPFRIEALAHMLRGAAAAAGEERADRGDARGRGRQDLDDLPPVAVAHGAHALARQGEGHENLAVRGFRNAVAALA
jgi:hypothetical protein